MTINTSDLKWKQSERLTDNDDGGGLMTNTEVVDGEVNNLLPDIGRLDRTSGVVNLRKPYAHVDTGNADVLTNAHGIVSAPPADANVTLTLISTDIPSDERAYAKEKIERYLGLGVNTGHQLYGGHYAGQKTLTLIRATGAPLPVVGDTLVLLVQATGASEYVRISDIQTEERSFTTYEQQAERNFKRTLLTLTIYTGLQSDYVGEEASYFPPTTIETGIYTTIVADAARYYGIARLAEAAAPGDKTVTVDSIFARIVPATESEIPVIDDRATADLDQYIAAGEAYTIARNGSGDTTLYEAWFDRSMVPGSVAVTLKLGSIVKWQLRDDGAGNLTTYTGGTTQSGQTIVFANADYASGRVQVSPSASIGSGAWWVEIAAQPAGIVVGAGRSQSQPVTLANRGYTWIQTLTPIPAPGVLSVSYRSLGRWYTLTDDGRGKLSSGSSGEGVGSVDYSTGTAQLTSGYLPDVDTAILWQWGSGVDAVRVDGASAEATAIQITGAVSGGIVPGAAGDFQIEYIAGGVTRTITDDGAGNLTGDGTGEVLYGAGSYGVTPAYLPDLGSVATISYNKVTRHTHDEVAPAPDGGGNVAIALGEACEPLGVNVEFVIEVPASAVPLRRIIAWDDGAGNLVRESYGDGSGTWITGEVIGSVTYATGAMSVLTTLAIATYTYDGFAATWDLVGETGTLSGDISVQYLVAGGSTAEIETPAISAIRGELLIATGRKYVTGSARLAVGGEASIDRNGTLYRTVSASTGAGTAAGSIDENGAFTISAWTGGGANTLDVQAGLAQYGVSTVSSFAFRVPVPTVRPQSLSVRATTPAGSTSTASSDAGGNVNGGVITGTVDYSTALVELTFSSPVLAATILYNAVGIKYIPLSAEVLGLDPVRLPQDGRVPIYRAGQEAVIHHTESEQLAAPLSAGQAVNLSRGPVSKLWLRDENGLTIPSALYTADLTATPATITFADPLDLSAYQQPLVAEHRIEQMRLIDEVQIGGQITFTIGLSINFPADETFVSTILRFGNLQARVAHLFTQKTWTNVWSDERIGDDSIAKYDDVAFPIEINNRNVITERWAIVFDSPTTFYVQGETRGVIATGSTGADCAPLNPFTAEPYFTIRAAGWGGGWVGNNVLRFNTIGALAPVWVIRTTQAGDATVTDDEGAIEFRGDSD